MGRMEQNRKGQRLGEGRSRPEQRRLACFFFLLCHYVSRMKSHAEGAESRWGLMSSFTVIALSTKLLVLHQSQEQGKTFKRAEVMCTFLKECDVGVASPRRMAAVQSSSPDPGPRERGRIGGRR